MQARLIQLDAFASCRFAGNPAAVMLFESYPADRILQALASENNLVETAFLVPDGGDFRIRDAARSGPQPERAAWRAEAVARAGAIARLITYGLNLPRFSFQAYRYWLSKWVPEMPARIAVLAFIAGIRGAFCSAQFVNIPSGHIACLRLGT